MSDINYIFKKSFRARRLRITLYPDKRCVVTLPYGFSESRAEDFLREKFSWIQKKLQYFDKHKIHFLPKSTKREYLARKKEAYAIIREKISFFNSFYKFTVGKITIRRQKTRWGSCSRKKNLNFNFNIIHLPQSLLNYLVVHELCHLKELNHSKNFWHLVSLQIPDYKILRKELKSLI